MSASDAARITSAAPERDPSAPDSAGKFSINEDWLAVITGLVLLTLALTGISPPGVIQ